MFCKWWRETTRPLYMWAAVFPASLRVESHRYWDSDDFCVCYLFHCFYVFHFTPFLRFRYCRNSKSPRIRIACLSENENWFIVWVSGSLIKMKRTFPGPLWLWLHSVFLQVLSFLSIYVLVWICYNICNFCLYLPGLIWIIRIEWCSCCVCMFASVVVCCVRKYHQTFGGEVAKPFCGLLGTSSDNPHHSVLVIK